MNSVTLNAKEFVRWGDGAGLGGGTNAESTATAHRATTGCTPPPAPPTDVCPNISGVQTTVPAGMVTDGSGNCVTPPPASASAATDVCPNLDGAQGVVPDGMVVDASGNCVTPAPPRPSVAPTSVTPKATPKPVVKHAQKKLVKKVVKKHVALAPDLAYGPHLYYRTKTTVAIAGHRTTHTHPFRNLNLLQPGDTIWAGHTAYWIVVLAARKS